MFVVSFKKNWVVVVVDLEDGVVVDLEDQELEVDSEDQ
jgi:phosphopantetheinyl transferase